MFRVPHKATLLALALAAAGQAAYAADALNLTVTQGGNSTTLSFKSLEDMINTYKTEADLRKALPWYDPKVDSVATMDNLGVKFNFQVDAGGTVSSTSVVMTAVDAKGNVVIPTKTYTGANQDAALQTMKDDIKASYSAVQTSLAATTPNSLTAGNPTSVQSQLASSQFDQGFTTSASQVVSTSAVSSATTTTTSTTSSSSASSASSSTAATTSATSSSATSRVANMLGLGLRFGQYKQGDLKSQTVTLPFGYSWRFDDDERRHVTLSLPLTLGKVEQSKVFNAQASLSVGIPVNEEWALTPSIGYGVAGSVDLAQAAQQVSASLTSSYLWSFENGHSLSMGNMVGRYSTVKMKIDEYTSNPNISNTILRNGLMYSMPLNAFSDLDNTITIEVSAINTRYLGTELYVTSQNEVGLTVGTNKRVKGATRYLRAGVSYISAKGASGYGVNVGYWF